jgi:hypothetical protein
VSAANLIEVTSRLYELLHPLEPDERARALAAVRALLGDPPVSDRGEAKSDERAPGERGYGPQAARWMDQNAVSPEQVENVLHVDNGVVEIIASGIPGAGKKEQTLNCYLLVGLRELFRAGAPKFSETDAVALCQHMGCHDKSNHSVIRKGFGNSVAGNKDSGYLLPAPGLKAAAELVKTLSNI